MALKIRGVNLMIKDYIRNNILLTDGAMGTYYAKLTGDYSGFSELANIDNPKIIKDIHEQYINAGAKLIRTNTFSANSKTLNISKEELETIITKGFQIARDACSGEDIYIAADIGPIPEIINNEQEIDRDSIMREYIFIVDTFLNLGADIFVFETFSSTEYLKEITQYLKSKNANAFIITQFVVMGDGYTRKGKSASKIAQDIKQIESIDVLGFNCGTGPTYLYNNISKIDFSGQDISVLPNSGFPEIVNERTVYSQNEDYFAEVIMRFVSIGARIIGGCCGTTPVHIKRINDKLQKDGNIEGNIEGKEKTKNIATQVVARRIEVKRRRENQFKEKLSNNEFVVAVELDPPFDSDIGKLIEGAKILKRNKVDIITVADSPLGRARVNAIITASRIMREAGIDVLPHICCRDRNLIALKSDILAAHMDEIRNILLVTGDPIPSAEKNEIKSVFNLNSARLISFANEMNKEQFKDNEMHIGAALNLNALNKDIEINRMQKKADAGASFCLTQPIFDDDTIKYLAKLKKPENVKILGGIMPIVSYGNAQFLNNEIPGIRIPREYIDMFKENMPRDEAEQIGIEVAVELANKIKNHVDGFFFMTPFNRVNMVVEIIKRTR